MTTDQDLVSQITESCAESTVGVPPSSSQKIGKEEEVPSCLVTPQSKKRTLGEIESEDHNENCDPNSKKIAP